MGDASKKVDVQISICRRRDGLYTVTVNRQGSSVRLTGCSWGEVELQLEAVAPRFRMKTEPASDEFARKANEPYRQLDILGNAIRNSVSYPATASVWKEPPAPPAIQTSSDPQSLPASLAGMNEKVPKSIDPSLLADYQRFWDSWEKWYEPIRKRQSLKHRLAISVANILNRFRSSSY